ncbi:MAG: universal stress protein [Deltaproteobacteria bacterium]|nr:universal stress protein [Deltaproteobacteria bacterium]
MLDFRRILAVSGLTEECRKAIGAGVSLAQRYGGELWVVHLVRKNPFELSGGDLPVDTIEHDYEPYLVEANKHLAEVLAATGAAAMPVRQLVKFGNPVAEIEKIVGEERIDLVVLLTRGEGRLEHYILGRGKDELIRRMPCSVLLVKAD